MVSQQAQVDPLQQPCATAPPSDLELAAHLQRALSADCVSPAGDAIARLLMQVLASDAASFVLAEQASGAGGVWAELFATAAARAGLATCRAVVGNRYPDHMAMPLLAGERLLGFVGISRMAGGYSPAVVQRFSQVAALLAVMLQAQVGGQQRQALLLDQARDALISIDCTGRISSWNRAAERLFGYAAGEIIGRQVNLLQVDDRDQPFQARVAGAGQTVITRLRTRGGDSFPASVALDAIPDSTGSSDGCVISVVDLGQQQAVENKLRLAARILERNTEAVLVTDGAERIVASNPAFSIITGYSESEVIGQSPAILFRQDGEALLRSTICSEIARAGEWRGELQFKRKNGEAFPGWTAIASVSDAAGGLLNHFFVFSDTSERQEAERRIHHLAYYDDLSGLPNRRLFNSLLEQALSSALRKRRHGALLFVDLNRFKHINESFGHTQADAILSEVATRLSLALRKQDIIARLGGDEFAIALTEIRRREHAGQVAKKVLASLAEPFYLDEHEILLSASIGISIFPEDGRDAATLLKNADVAMVRAKQRGNSAHLFYSQEMNQRSFEQLKLEGGLRRAIERSELHLVYQPQLDLVSGRIAGAEALLRWQHPEHGLISPAQFIPVAEETGLINPIGEWVINAACSQIREWMDQGLACVHVAVNLSARQFSASLPRKVAGLIARHGIPSDFLEVEITESMLMHSADSVVDMMRAFGDAGVLMTLDDFGTGYSSLSYLKRFPIDNLKIDQSFVRGIPHDRDDSAIARTIISMARNLGLSVIAEGVENLAQLEFLREAGCEEIQGYYFSRPLAAGAFADLLRQTNC